MDATRSYAEYGDPSQQARPSTANPNAADVQMRILIELQVISFLLSRAYGTPEDISQMRRDVAASM